MSPVHCTIVIFASFFLTDQFKSNFKIADQDLFYDTMKRGEFQILKKTTCPVLLFENVCYSPLFEAFLEKVPFLETHSFRLTKTFVGDTFFGGSDEPP